MEHFRRFHVRMLITLSVLVLAVTACGARPATFSALRSTADDGTKALRTAAEPSDLSGVRSELDDLLAKTPARSGYTADEQELIDSAKRITAVLQIIGRTIDASDAVMAGTSTDAVSLVAAVRIRNPRLDFRQHMENTTARMLKEAACAGFAQEMNRVAEDRERVQELLAHDPYGARTKESIRKELDEAIELAGYSLQSASVTLNLAGLSSSILSKTSDYVDRVKGLMDASSWESDGAVYYYVRYCVAS